MLRMNRCYGGSDKGRLSSVWRGAAQSLSSQLKQTEGRGSLHLVKALHEGAQTVIAVAVLWQGAAQAGVQDVAVDVRLQRSLDLLLIAGEADLGPATYTQSMNIPDTYSDAHKSERDSSCVTCMTEGQQMVKAAFLPDVVTD